jgi:hypothetical protein
MNGNEGATPSPVEQTRMLIGEGREEILFFKALLSHLRIHNVAVDHYGGKSGLVAYLRALKNRSGFAKVDQLFSRTAALKPHKKSQLQ